MNPYSLKLESAIALDQAEAQHYLDFATEFKSTIAGRGSITAT
jgi:hypothetical protein